MKSSISVSRKIVIKIVIFVVFFIVILIFVPAVICFAIDDLATEVNTFVIFKAFLARLNHVLLEVCLHILLVSL